MTTMQYHRAPGDLLHLAFARTARAHWDALAIADSTGQKLTYGRALIASIALGRALARRTRDEQMVGTLLPASAGGALANLALFFAGLTPVNLNFTIGPEALDGAIRQAGIKTIVSSKRFLEKAGLPLLPSMIFLEDLRGEVGTADKLVAALQAKLLPISWLSGRTRADNGTSPLATIIFSSGSTGVPKGVMLSHANVLSNVEALTQSFDLRETDRFLGVLPFFHSFGFTGTLWLPLLVGAGVIYHPNPADAKTIGELCGTHGVTFLISTPTFCNSYVRRCTKEQFAKLRFAIVGAEKLREPLPTEFREKYGISLLEGYGVTEMAPVISVNRPEMGGPHGQHGGIKPGSVGQPIPGVSAKIVDRDNGAPLPIGQEGLLLVNGPNMMQGYLNAPDRTAEVIRDGWYATGDIAKLDDQGFIFITDRLSRFSKIGGEMVPHVRIEDAINHILGEVGSAVTAVPDAAKGERLVAFYTKGDMSPEALWDRLCQTELPRLWIPKRDSLFYLEAIPTLGTGKVDLRTIKLLAQERAESVTT